MELRHKPRVFRPGYLTESHILMTMKTHLIVAQYELSEEEHA